MQSSTAISVGSMVRAKRPFLPSSSSHSGGKDGSSFIMGLAQVLFNEEEDRVTLIWDDPAPRPIGEQLKFFVTPTFGVESNVKESYSLEQENVPKSSLTPSFQFELEILSAENTAGKKNVDEDAIACKKERGDKFLQLKDPTAALQWYESALHSSSIVQVGGQIVINLAGHPTIAEIDCIDDDDTGKASNTTLDVTYTKADGVEEEVSIASSRVLLAVYHDAAQHVQGRILLNMARCLHMLAHCDLQIESKRRKVYLQASVVACSLALCLLSSKLHDTDDDNMATLENFIFKARYLRAKSYLEMGRTKHALADARKLPKAKSTVDAKDESVIAKLIKDITMKARKDQVASKRLTKHICSWVDQATAPSDKGDKDDAVSDKMELTSLEENNSREKQNLHEDSQAHSPSILVLFVAVTIALALLQYPFSF
jgi:hypothetical protein